MDQHQAETAEANMKTTDAPAAGAAPESPALSTEQGDALAAAREEALLSAVAQSAAPADAPVSAAPASAYPASENTAAPPEPAAAAAPVADAQTQDAAEAAPAVEAAPAAEGVSAAPASATPASENTAAPAEPAAAAPVADAPTQAAAESAPMVEAAPAAEGQGLREFEVKTHEVTRRLGRNFEGLFPGRALAKTPHTAVTLALQTHHRMSAMSSEMMSERTSCYNMLIARMQLFRDRVNALGYWCDFIDPSSGAPFHSDSATTFAETDDRIRSLGFQVLELGCCRAVCCQRFGQCMVMTTAFVEAPVESLTDALKLLEADPAS